MTNAAAMATNTAPQVTRPGLLMLLLVMLPLATSVAEALDAGRQITQLGHKAWRVRDGYFNAMPSAIAQTKDGYMWIGTHGGLLRFDGVRFVPWEAPAGSKLPSTNVTALLGARDGSLWIGTQGGLAHWAGAMLTTIPAERGPVTSIYQDPDGNIWFGQSTVPHSTGAFCQVVDAVARCYPGPAGTPRRHVAAITGDAHGVVWAGTESGVLRWRAGAMDEFPTSGTDDYVGGVQALAATPAGTLWVGVPQGGPNLGLQQLVDGEWKPYRTAKFDSSTLPVTALLLDEEQTLWIGTASEGLYRIRGDAVDQFRAEDGLSGNLVYQLVQDREGTVWAMTSGGLDSFRDLPVATLTGREGLTMTEVDSILASRDGTVWVGGADALDALRGDRITAIRPGSGLPGHQVTSLFEDRAGGLWVGIDFGLTVYRDGRFHPVRTREGKPTGLIVDLTQDVDGAIWAETTGETRKLLRIENETVTREYPSPAMPAARRLAADPAGGIWLGLMTGEIARFRAGRLETFSYWNSKAPSLDNAVTQIHVEPDGSVLAASPLGLIGWRAGTRRTLTVGNGLPCDRIQGFVSDLEGDLWLYMQCGLVEIAKDQLQAWWRTPNARVQPRVLDSVDGVHAGFAPFVSAARAPDGRLWFINGAAVQMIDPARLATNSVLPPVRIESVVADRKTYWPVDSLRLPAGTRDIEIDYTALSFVAPQKVRFRYRLEGHDTQWQEPGARRQALYNDLKPGTYSFRVIAANNDGLWNEAGATLRFSVAPAWYQTNAFRVLCVVLGTLLLWLIHRARVWQVANALSARFDARLAERTRIARELHDTLLQTIQASKLVADSALAPSADPKHARRSLERLSVWLETAVLEGRAALNSLRSSTTERNDLAEALRAAAQDDAPASMEVAMRVSGAVREMHPIVRDEISRIGCEAIRNALRHSGGSQLEIDLIYGNDLRLRVSDNGKGIAPAVIARGATGHFGIQGMRERATNIGGTLSFVSTAAAGTQIELIVPGNIIYERPSRQARAASG